MQYKVSVALFFFLNTLQDKVSGDQILIGHCVQVMQTIFESEQNMKSWSYITDQKSCQEQLL